MDGERRGRLRAGSRTTLKVEDRDSGKLAKDMFGIVRGLFNFRLRVLRHIIWVHLTNIIKGNQSSLPFFVAVPPVPNEFQALGAR